MNVSDKETRAVFLNFKELRSLEKNVQALDLEKAYSISLITLDQKLMKVSYKKLKDKVSRIRSHLNNDSIDELKHLEESGKLNLEPSASKVDFNIQIQAASKRLKLQSRAKSAVPRLQSGKSKTGSMGSRATYFQTPVQTPTSLVPRVTTARTPSAPASRSKVQAGSGRPSTPVTHRPVSTAKPSISVVVDEAPASDFPVPRSIRQERRQSIDIRCISEISDAHKNPPNIKVSPASDMRGSRESISMLGLPDGAPPSRRPSILKISQTQNPTSRPATPEGSKSVTGQGGISASQTPTFLQLPTQDSSNNPPTTSGHVDDGLSVNSLSVPFPSVQNATSDTKIRPLSVPANNVTNFDDTAQRKRPLTSTQLAFETRKKSIAGIQRASTLLAEGKTRVPFSSHDLKAIEEKSKIAKPFRSIREGKFSVGLDRDISDNTLGDDLHKEMKKGMILGELANSLLLEDKIDHFLDKVDQYVKENPNYTYDPERTRAELEARREANKAKKKKTKRNKLRRRQLQRRLQEENAMSEAAKSRYLRVSDDKLDLSGVQTLAVEQMRMLHRLKCWNEDSD